MDKDRYIYITISKTATKFGCVLRRVGRVRFNHASVALDAELNEWYSFARKQHKTVLIGGLVKENIDRYTLRRYSNVQVVIFRIPVTERQYQRVRHMIMKIRRDKDYMYNLISVLTFPLTKGFSIYKGYSCIEFTMLVLNLLGYSLDKPAYQYIPDELLDILSNHRIFEGNLLDYKSPSVRDEDYFRPMTFSQVIQSGWNLLRLMKRSVVSYIGS